MTWATTAPAKTFAPARVSCPGYRATRFISKIASSFPLLSLLLALKQDFFPASALRDLFSSPQPCARIVLSKTTANVVVHPIRICHCRSP
jgi:hypothetical protein